MIGTPSASCVRERLGHRGQSLLERCEKPIAVLVLEVVDHVDHDERICSAELELLVHRTGSGRSRGGFGLLPPHASMTYRAACSLTPLRNMLPVAILVSSLSAVSSSSRVWPRTSAASSRSRLLASVAQVRTPRSRSARPVAPRDQRRVLADRLTRRLDDLRAFLDQALHAGTHLTGPGYTRVASRSSIRSRWPRVWARCSSNAFQFLRAGGAGHFRQCVDQLLLGAPEIVQLLREHILQRPVPTKPPRSDGRRETPCT